MKTALRKLFARRGAIPGGLLPSDPGRMAGAGGVELSAVTPQPAPEGPLPSSRSPWTEFQLVDLQAEGDGYIYHQCRPPDPSGGCVRPGWCAP